MKAARPAVQDGVPVEQRRGQPLDAIFRQQGYSIGMEGSGGPIYYHLHQLSQIERG